MPAPCTRSSTVAIERRARIAAMKNDTFLRALMREPTPYTPIWIMRQAGRYLPEYNATRKRAGSFLKLAQTPELACEVTLQPLERFPLDAAILFSDILTVPDAMGLGLHFVEGEGPKFERPLRTEADIGRLEVPDMAKLRYVFEAVALIRKTLNGRVPLIGFSGSPFTLACYMIEGSGSDDFRLEVDALLAPGIAAPHPRHQCPGGGGVPQRADRGRGAGGDGVRYLGRRALRCRVRGIL